MKKLYLIILTLVLTFIATSFGPVYKAGAEEITPVEKSVNELITIRDDTSFTEEEKLLKEIELRKNILAEVIKLSIEEVEKLKAKLDSLPKFEKESIEYKIKSDFALSLGSYMEYYTAQLEKVNNLQQLDEAKKLAQDIKDYRDNIYNPGVKEVLNFVLIFYNKNVLGIANTRLNKISLDIDKLEDLGYLKPDQFATQISEATRLLFDATQLQQESQTLVLAPYQQPEQLTVLESAADEKVVTEDEVLEDKTPEPGALIEESLSKVKSAYTIFLQIGKDIRIILGIE